MGFVSMIRFIHMLSCFFISYRFCYLRDELMFSDADSGFVPIFVYAIFGSSRQLAIGPVTLVSLLVSNVLGNIVDPSDALYTELAILLAFMVGVLECIMGLLRYHTVTIFSRFYL